jgi:hypothetical protein
MKDHHGHFWVCFWLFMIWLAMPSFSQVENINQSLEKIATSISQTNTAR